MRIKARMGVSLDGFAATTDGIPTIATRPDFVPHASHGFPEFIEGCEAVAMGRTTFLPALGAPAWPWPDQSVYVLTSSPLPEGTPAHVVAVHGGAEAMVTALRERDSNADVHLVGGPRTIAAVHGTGALDSLELVVVPVLLGDGLRLWPDGEDVAEARLVGAPRRHPDGSLQVTYALD